MPRSTPSCTGNRYYANFEVADAGEVATTRKERTFPFTTSPKGQPEIPDLCGYNISTFKEIEHTRVVRSFGAQVETNDTPAEYHFEYTSEPPPASSWTPFNSGASGSVVPMSISGPLGPESFIENDFADPMASLEGLTAETRYYVRLRVCQLNGKCSGSAKCEISLCSEALASFKTPPVRPVVEGPGFRNVTAASVHLFDQVNPSGSTTDWRFEYTTEPDNQSSWNTIAGAEGDISQSQAEGLPEGIDATVEGSLTGLSPSTKYCVRAYASNKFGEGENFFEELILTETRGWTCFETAGPPTVTTSETHAIDGESLRLLGELNPNSVATSEEQTIALSGTPSGGSFTLSFDGEKTDPIEYNASSSRVRAALGSLASKPEVTVSGFDGGPYLVVFVGTNAGINEPQIAANEGGLTPKEKVTVSTTQEGGESYEAKYYFEYTTQEEYERSGFAGATKLSEMPVSAVNGAEFVGENAPALEPGESYMYRLVVTSTFPPGNTVVDGKSETISVPTHSLFEEPVCPNAQLRVGPS